jgi:hypothetical protein
MSQPGDNLQKPEVQMEINRIVDESNEAIKNIIDDKNVAEESVGWGNYIIPPMFVIGFACVYTFLKLYDKSTIIFSLFKWMIALGIYVAFVLYVNIYRTPKDEKRNVDIAKILSASLVPVFVILGLLKFFPNLSTPVDNTLGFLYATKFSSARRVIQYFNYDVKKDSLINRLNIPINEMSFGWLIKSLNPDKMVEFFENSKDVNKDENSKDENGEQINFMEYFYIETGATGSDAYTSNDAISDLKSLINSKQMVGHMVYILIASAFGLTTSMLTTI